MSPKKKGIFYSIKACGKFLNNLLSDGVRSKWASWGDYVKDKAERMRSKDWSKCKITS